MAFTRVKVHKLQRNFLMKNHLSFLLLAGIMVVVPLLSGCDDDEVAENQQPSAILEVSSVGANYAYITITSTAMSSYAYAVYPVDDDLASLPDESVLFHSGTSGSCSSDGTTSVYASNLDVNTSQHAYFAFITSSGEYYGDILELTFTTTDFTEPMTVTNIDYDGFTMHLKIPQETLERGNALRYNCSNIYVHNNLGSLDAQSLLFNGGYYTLEDTSIEYYDRTVYLSDDDEYEFHDPYVPGEPIYYMVGEFEWGDGSYYGWGEGYYVPLFDSDAYYADNDSDDVEYLSTKSSQADYWSGFYDTMIITTKAPSVLDASLNISSEMSATRGTLLIEPDDAIVQGQLLIIDDATYRSSLLPLIDNDESYMQWLVTSYAAYVYLSTANFTNEGKPIQIDLVDDYFNSALEPETRYHAFVVGMGNDEGTSQCFEDYEFETTARTAAAPEVVVTAISNPSGTESPYEAWFNVKSPSKDVDYAYYAANYERDWAYVLNNGYTYADVAAQGNEFSSSEVEAINSDEGYDIMVPTRADATVIMAVLGYNEEDTPNDIEDEDDDAVATVHTIDEVYSDRVESSLFEDLLGEWTAIYTVNADTYHATGKYKTKVTISSGVTYPQTLDSSVYDEYYALGDSWTQEKVDALYDEFKEECDDFNDGVRGNNRLLCMGFAVDMDEATPYDLFIADSDTYNSYDIESTLYDFGPKWYIEIAEDGTISVPFNSQRMYPMSSWTASYGSYLTYYLMGRGITSSSYSASYISVGDDYETVYFPATISDDKQTITIDAYVNSSDTFYPNAGRISSNVVYDKGQIISSIELTKGWDDSTSSSSISASSLPVEMAQVNAEPQLCRIKARTSMATLKKYEKMTAPVVTKETIERGRVKMIEDYRNGRLK